MIWILTAALWAAVETPPIPEGLWRSKDEGFVIRVSPCGDGFCGYAAGAPESSKKGKPKDICGKQMLKDFRWNASKKRWEGTMQPPDTKISINSSVETDGKTFLTLRGRMLVMSKTMQLEPFAGKIGNGCRLE
ncbi:MAG: DUF2147 domain-containing protein [Bryobacteraceae bacterium]|nr:DUF2147 domain-containing protein [Bryobacteraceae bacterium]